MRQYITTTLMALAFAAHAADASPASSPDYASCAKRYYAELRKFETLKFVQTNYEFDEATKQYNKPKTKASWVIVRRSDKAKAVYSYKREEYVSRFGKFELLSIEAGNSEKLSVYNAADSELNLHSKAGGKEAAERIATTRSKLPLILTPLEPLILDLRGNDRTIDRLSTLLEKNLSDDDIDKRVKLSVKSAGIHKKPDGTGLYYKQWVGHEFWAVPLADGSLESWPAYSYFTMNIRFEKAKVIMPVVAMGSTEILYEEFESKRVPGKYLILATGERSTATEFRSRLSEVVVDSPVEEADLVIDPTMAKKIYDHTTGMFLEE